MYDGRHHDFIAKTKQEEHRSSRSRELFVQFAQLRLEERARRSRRTRVLRRHRTIDDKELSNHELIIARVSLRRRFSFAMSSSRSKSLLERANRSYEVRENRERETLRRLRVECEDILARVDEERLK